MRLVASLPDRGRDDADVLDFGLGGEFLVGEDIDLRQRRFEEAFEGEAEFRAENHGGEEALLGHRVRANGEFAQEVLSGLRVECEGRLEMRALDACDEGLLKARIERNRFDEARLGFVLGDEIGAEALADLLGEFVGVFRDGGVISDGFENEREVFDRHAFAEEVLENALDDAEVDEIGEEFGDERGVGFLHAVHEALDLLAAQDQVGALFEGFRQVRDQDRDGIDDAVAVDFGGAFFLLGDPDGFNAENGFAGRDAFERDVAATDIHREPAVRDNGRVGDRFAAKQEAVFVRLEFQAVANRDGWDDHAVVAREAFADAGDAVEQVAALGFVGETEEAVADFDGEDFGLDEFVEILGSFAVGAWLACRGGLGTSASTPRSGRSG